MRILLRNSKGNVRTFILLLHILIPSAFSAEGDWIYRQDLNASIKLSDRYQVLSRSSVFLEKDMSNLQAVFTGLNLGYTVVPSIRLEAGYRHIWLDPNGLDRAERRSQVALAWSGKYKEVRISNRSRLEYRDYDWNRKNDFRFRNSTGVVLPWPELPWELNPYMEEEFFFGHNRGKLEQNWLTAGLQWKATPNLRVKAGYRWITLRRGDEWENRNMLVANLSLYF